MDRLFRGTGVALITPFDGNGQIDWQGLKGVINHVIEGGVEYVVSLGTTGESATLSKSEKLEVLETTVETVNGRVPVVAGFGGNNTQAIIRDIQDFHFRGVEGILSVSPYYNKPTQQGIYLHYKALSESTDKPIILYNVPGRTSSNITADTTLRLAHDFNTIVAIKEASGDLEQCMEIVRGRPDGFSVISGEDPLTLPMISFGMDGVISVVANAYPKEYSDMVRLALKGAFSSAAPLHFKLLPVIKGLFAEGNPGGVKAAMKILGVCEDHLRLPLANISESAFKKLKEAMNAI